MDRHGRQNDSGVPWPVPGLVFGISLCAIDVSLRRETLASWSHHELRQYVLSSVGCVLFWVGTGAAFSWFSRAPRLLRWTGVPVLVAAAALLVAAPYWVWLNLGRFPNQEMVIFLANQLSFVGRMSTSYWSVREVFVLVLSVTSISTLAVLSMKARRPEREKWRRRTASTGHASSNFSTHCDLIALSTPAHSMRHWSPIPTSPTSGPTLKQ